MQTESMNNVEEPLKVFDETINYISMTPLVPYYYYFKVKTFTCKGKHQYKEENGVWVCQCGRKVDD